MCRRGVNAWAKIVVGVAAGDRDFIAFVCGDRIDWCQHGCGVGDKGLQCAGCRSAIIVRHGDCYRVDAFAGKRVICRDFSDRWSRGSSRSRDACDRGRRGSVAPVDRRVKRFGGRTKCETRIGDCEQSGKCGCGVFRCRDIIQARKRWVGVADHGHHATSDLFAVVISQCEFNDVDSVIRINVIRRDRTSEGTCVQDSPARTQSLRRPN